MLSAEPPHHIHIAFDDHHLVADADLTGPTAALRCIRAKGTCSNHEGVQFVVVAVQTTLLFLERELSYP